MKICVNILLLTILFSSCNKEKLYPERIEGFWREVKDIDDFFSIPLVISFENGNYLEFSKNRVCDLNDEADFPPVKYVIDGDYIYIESSTIADTLKIEP